MVKTTRKQREAIKRVYDRAILWLGQKGNMPMPSSLRPTTVGENPMTYRQFRRQAYSAMGCDSAVVLPWCGLWLCIEQDGYTHS